MVVNMLVSKIFEVGCVGWANEVRRPGHFEFAVHESLPGKTSKPVVLEHLISARGSCKA